MIQEMGTGGGGLAALGGLGRNLGYIISEKSQGMNSGLVVSICPVGIFICIQMEISG